MLQPKMIIIFNVLAIYRILLRISVLVKKIGIKIIFITMWYCDLNLVYFASYLFRVF